MYWKRRGQEAARVGHFKWIRNEGRTLLFDLSKDIGEKKDLFPKKPETADQLIEECDRWNAGLKPTAFPTLMGDKWWER